MVRPGLRSNDLNRVAQKLFDPLQEGLVEAVELLEVPLNLSEESFFDSVHPLDHTLQEQVDIGIDLAKRSLPAF